MPARKIQEDGTYPEGTVNYVVSQKLMELARRAKELEKKLKPVDDSGKTSNLS